jgi:hypothetical protein
MVVVKDMWLTGFDAPVLHTLYIDKPMRDHTISKCIWRSAAAEMWGPGRDLAEVASATRPSSAPFRGSLRSALSGRP